MSATSKPLCIIPARGGSKRFPRKNVAMLGGKPLLVWSIESAKDSGIFDEVWVSSEDREILSIAEQYGASPLVRTESLADDCVSVAEVCAAISEDFTNQKNPHDILMALLPTSPFRSGATIRDAYALFVERDADALISCSALEHPPEWVMTVSDGFLCALDSRAYNTPRNMLPKSVRGDGLIMMARRDFLQKHKSFLGKRTLAFDSPSNETIDIDKPKDLLWAEFLLSRQKAPL